MFSLTLAALLNDGPTQVCFLLPLALILVDFVTGVLSAVKSHAYHTRYLADFVSSSVLPYLTILVGSVAVPVLIHNVSYAVAALGAKAVLTVFLLSQVDSIVHNISEMTGVPEGSLDALVRGLIGLFLPATEIPVVAPPSGSGAVTRPAVAVVTAESVAAAQRIAAQIQPNTNETVYDLGAHGMLTWHNTTATNTVVPVLTPAPVSLAPEASTTATTSATPLTAEETPTLVLPAVGPKVTQLLPIVSPEDIAAATDASQVRGRA